MTTRHRTHAVLTWLVRCACRLYPRGSPATLTQDMNRVFDEELRRRRESNGWLAAMWFATETLAGVLWDVARARFGGWSMNPRQIFSGGAARIALRSMRHAPGVSLTIIATLALSVGVNGAVLAVFYDLVLRPLPFAGHESVVPVFNVTGGDPLRYRHTTGWIQYEDFREHADLFESFGVWREPRTVVANATSMTAVEVTPDLFDVLAVRPLMGRLTVPSGDAAGLPSVVLVETAWQRHFSADPGVIGTTLTLANEGPVVIVGIAPRSVSALDARVDLVILRPPNAEDPNPPLRIFGAGQLWARLKPGVDRSAALAQLAGLDQRWADTIATPEERRSFEALSVTQAFEQPNPLAPSLAGLQAGAATVMLIGAINVGLLLLGRFCLRAPDYSIHYTLGAGLPGLLRLAAWESLLLGVLSVIVGGSLAQFALQYSARYVRGLAPSSTDVALSVPVVVVVTAGTLVLTTAIGLVAMLVLWKTGVIGRIDTSARSATATARISRLSLRLVVAQVSLAFVLLIGAGLLGRSLANVLAVRPGFDPSRVVVGQIDTTGIVDRSARLDTRERIEASLETLPGVEGVSTMGSYWPPVISKSENTAMVAIKGDPPPAAGREPEVLLLAVPPDFFATMGISIVDGLTCPAGIPPPTPQLVVDRLFAERFMPGRRAVGTDVHLFNGAYRPPQAWSPIVGVSERANLQGLETPDGTPVAYICRDRSPFTAFNVLLRTTRDADGIVRDVQARLSQIDPRLYLQRAGTYDTHLNQLHVGREGLTGLMGVFALLALVLSATGLMGILAFDVAQRRRDIAIRLAVGATHRRVIGSMLGRALGGTLAGLAMGATGAVALSLYLRSVLFGVAPFDVWTYAGVAGLLCLVALIAGGLPAIRAIRIDPRESLSA